MADSLEVFGFCGANCRHRVLTVDQTAALIQEMAANGFQVPEGFIPKTSVNSIIEQNTGKEIKLFIGTQAEYDAWTGDKESLFAIISDDPALKDILNRLDDLDLSLKSFDSSLNTAINIINERLNDLGFKDGVAGYSGFIGSPLTNYIKKQGKHAIFNFDIVSATSVINPNGTVTITIPQEFRPKEEIDIVILNTVTGVVSGTFASTIKLGTDGIITFTTGSAGSFAFQILNAGWEIN